MKPLPLTLSIDGTHCAFLKAHAEERIEQLLARRRASSTIEVRQALREQIEIFRDLIAAIDYARVERGLTI